MRLLGFLALLQKSISITETYLVKPIIYISVFYFRSHINITNMSGGRFNFPRWNYGYTLGPPTAANAGNYTQFMQPSVQQYPGWNHEF